MPTGDKRRRRTARTPSAATIAKGLRGEFFPEDIHLYRIDRHTFTLSLVGETTQLDGEAQSNEPGVEHNMANRFETNIRNLSGINTERSILVIMATPGGYWEQGMRIFSAILTCPNPVTILATDNARSMSSIIPLAADRFILTPSAKYMFHHGSYDFSGLTQEGITDFRELIKTRELMLQIYTARLQEQGKFKRKRWSRSRIYNMLEREMEKSIDVWLSTDEAVEWGFSDSLLSKAEDLNKIRAKKRNDARREAMFRVLRASINVDINVKTTFP